MADTVSPLALQKMAESRWTKPGQKGTPKPIEESHPELMEKVKEALAQGKSRREIERTFHINHRTIENFLKRNGGNEGAARKSLAVKSWLVTDVVIGKLFDAARKLKIKNVTADDLSRLARTAMETSRLGLEQVGEGPAPKIEINVIQHKRDMELLAATRTEIERLRKELGLDAIDVTPKPEEPKKLESGDVISQTSICSLNTAESKILVETSAPQDAPTLLRPTPSGTSTEPC